MDLVAQIVGPFTMSFEAGLVLTVGTTQGTIPAHYPAGALKWPSSVAPPVLLDPKFPSAWTGFRSQRPRVGSSLLREMLRRLGAGAE